MVGLSLAELVGLISLCVGILAGLETFFKKEGAGRAIIRWLYNVLKSFFSFPSRVVSELTEIKNEIKERGIINENALNSIQSEQKKNSEAARETNALLKLSDELDSSLKFMLDAQGRCVSINRIFLKRFGYNANDMAGFNWENVIHPADFNAVTELWKRSIFLQKEFHSFHRLQTATGETIKCEVLGLPIKIDEDFKGFYGIIYCLETIK